MSDIKTLFIDFATEVVREVLVELKEESLQPDKEEGDLCAAAVEDILLFIQDSIAGRLKEKTGWGRNEIKDIIDQTCSDARQRFIYGARGPNDKPF